MLRPQGGVESTGERERRTLDAHASERERERERERQRERQREIVLECSLRPSQLRVFRDQRERERESECTEIQWVKLVD